MRGKKPFDVSITLDIPPDETTKFWNQYIELDKGPVLLGIINELRNNFEPFVNLYNEMKAKLLTVNELIRALEVAQDIEEKTFYLESLEDKISEAEDKNSKLQLEIKEKINIITAFSSEILSLQKVKNSLSLQVRLAHEKMRNMFFIKGGI